MVVNFRSQGSQSYAELGGSIVVQGCSFDDIVGVVAITCVQAQENKLN